MGLLTALSIFSPRQIVRVSRSQHVNSGFAGQIGGLSPFSTLTDMGFLGLGDDVERCQMSLRPNADPRRIDIDIEVADNDDSSRSSHYKYFPYDHNKHDHEQ